MSLFVLTADGHNGSRAAELAASRLHLLLAADPALRFFTGAIHHSYVQCNKTHSPQSLEEVGLVHR